VPLSNEELYEIARRKLIRKMNSRTARSRFGLWRKIFDPDIEIVVNKLKEDSQMLLTLKALSTAEYVSLVKLLARLSL
jgi:hypothetical protein